MRVLDDRAFDNAVSLSFSSEPLAVIRSVNGIVSLDLTSILSRPLPSYPYA